MTESKSSEIEVPRNLGTMQKVHFPLHPSWTFRNALAVDVEGQAVLQGSRPDSFDNIITLDDILADMKEVNAQMKAYMLRYKEEHLTKKEAFAAFELDW